MTDGRARAVPLAAFCAGLMIAQQVAAKALRDSLFLSSLPVTELPKVMLAAALLGLPVVLATGAGMARFSPGRMVPALLLVGAALHGVEWWLLAAAPRQAAVLVYLHVSVVGAITISGFWSIVNERFDPHGARRAIGIISGTGGVGGLAGGLIAERVGSSLGLRSLLVVLLGGAVMSALGTFRLGASLSRVAVPSADRSGLRSLGQSPYLRSLSTLVALTAFGTAFTDYVFKASAPRSFHSGPELVRFFTAFYVATSVVTVVLQLAASRQMLDRIGLGGALATLPFVVVVCGVVAVVAPSLATIALLSGASATFQNSLFRSAYELLYTPLPGAKKRGVKALIDVACGRFGEVVASGLILSLLALSPALAWRGAIALAIVAAAVCLRLSIRLQSGYVSELATSLRNGSVQLDASRVDDLTTRLALSQTQLEFDRAELLRQIALSRQAAEPSSAPAPLHPFGEPGVLAELWSGDTERIRAVLLAPSLDPRHTSLVLPLLENDELAPDAVRALRTVGPKISGQLVDALLDRELPLKLRRRIPRVLRTCAVSRAARGLADALSDPDFEVRYRSALALHELVAQDDRLRTAAHLVFDAARRELESGELGADARRLDHVFTVLGLALDREALLLAQRALGKNDGKLRGTALEYLENVVPERVRTALWPHLEGRPHLPDAAPQSRRPTPQILDELKRSVG
jgi:hypothetical protein